MKALVVDDSVSVRAMLKAMLEPLKFKVKEAEDGLQALKALEKDASYDLVLVDWNMPRMNGLCSNAYARQVRAKRWHGHRRWWCLTWPSS